MNPTDLNSFSQGDHRDKKCGHERERDECERNGDGDHKKSDWKGRDESEDHNTDWQGPVSMQREDHNGDRDHKGDKDHEGDKDRKGHKDHKDDCDDDDDSDDSDSKKSSTSTTSTTETAAVLPDTGGVSLGWIPLGGGLIVAGAALISRRRTI
ncbi:LPXTG cell wall anchor domain-containing protein [Aeromicrobium sp.]